MLYLYIFLTGIIFGRAIMVAQVDGMDWPTTIFHVCFLTVFWPVIMPFVLLSMLCGKYYE